MKRFCGTIRVFSATASILVVCTLCSCGDRAAKNASDTVREQVEQIKSQNAEAPLPKASSVDYKAELAHAEAVMLEGIALAPGVLPPNLTGVTFYPTQMAAILEFTDDQNVTIFTPSGQRVAANYSVDSANDISELALEFKFRGQRKHAVYQVLRGHGIAVLKLESIEDEGEPLALLLKANLQ